MTAVNLGALALMVDVLGIPYLAACVFSFFLLNALGYLLNKVFTFRLQLRVVPREAARYYLIMAVSLALNLVLMAFLVEVAGLGVLAASLLVSGVLAVFNYLAHASLTFRLAGPPGQTAVLQVSAFFASHGGGIEVVASQLAHRLLATGWKITWIAGSKDTIRDTSVPTGGLRCLGAPFYDPLESRMGMPFPIWTVSGIAILWREVRGARLVHVHDYLYLPSLLAILFARVLAKPVVLTQHIGMIPYRSRAARGLLRFLNHTIGRLVLKAADQVVFVGRPVQEYFGAFVAFSRPPLLVPNGVDHGLFRPSPDRPLASGRVRLLFVGRFVEKKGLELIRHCVDLEGCHWTFIGWGPLSPMQWDIRGRPVEVLGRLTQEEVARALQQADLLVLPSSGEGFPLVVQEALACGTPVLVSREVEEAFPRVDPDCVFSVELRGSEPAKILRNSLAALIAQSDRLARARGVALALSRQWSWEQSVMEYSSIYSALCGTSVSPVALLRSE